MDAPPVRWGILGTGLIAGAFAYAVRTGTRGHLAVVEQMHPDNMLTPIVRVIYHTGRRQYLTVPAEVDLARKIGNHYGHIVRAENFEDWGISPLRWQPA